MALDILRVVQILWAVGDVLLTGGAFSLLGVYSSNQDRDCRRGGLVLWALCGVAPMALYLLGYLITVGSKQLSMRHPANFKLLTMLAAANNIAIGVVYQHKAASCGTTVTKILLAVFGAMPVWGELLKQIIKASSQGKKRHFSQGGQPPPPVVRLTASADSHQHFHKTDRV